jgi:hypothetical protein
MSHKHQLSAEVTFEGLHSWFKHTFEKAGWMILEMDKGHHDSIQNYIIEIDHLLEAIKTRAKKIKEKDRLDDLKILEKNLKILKKHITQK